MKTKPFFLLFSFLALVPLSAQTALFKPFTSLKVIKTEKFDIIFPKESESSARVLAEYADRVYEQISSTLGIEVWRRIPVTITPHTDSFNGYYDQIFNHIVLYDTPMDIEWTSFANNLESLFIHELTHAVSLNSKNAGIEVMNRIFGGWVQPSFISAPYFMIEGVTVSFESLDGTGRANDPRIKQYVRQAAHEDKFLTPFQTGGVYDKNTQPSGYWYEYGGLYSTWLIQQYGMEKYAALWQAMGGIPGFSFNVYRSGFYRLFKKVYDIDFIQTWNEFKKSLLIDGLQTNDDELPPTKHLFYKEEERFIRGLTAQGNNLFYIERAQGKINIYNTETKTASSINTGFYSYYLDVKAQENEKRKNNRMLVSGYRYVQDRATAIVQEYKLNGSKTGRSIKGLYKASYFRDGVIGIKSHLHNNRIVYQDFKGKSETLVAGTNNLMFSNPKVLDNDRIVFIAAVNGKREIWLYEYESKDVYRIESQSANSPINGLSDYVSYARGLSVSDGRLSFAYNKDDRMYKLALVDLNTMQAVFSNIEFSGGVFNPVIANNAVYYQGSFVSYDRLFKFPEPINTISGTQVAIHLVKIENQTTTVATKDMDNEVEFNPKAYFGLKYLDPLRAWLPMLLLRYPENNDGTSAIRFDGPGILFFVTDPAERNYVTMFAYVDWFYKMALVEELSWQNFYLGFPLTFSFSDTVVETSNDIYRSTNAGISADVNWISGQWINSFNIGGMYLRKADCQQSKGAYEWAKTKDAFAAFSGLSLHFRRLQLTLNGISFIDTFEPRIDGLLSVSTANKMPLYLRLFGAYDAKGMDLHGKSNNYGEPLITDYALVEYQRPKALELTWLGGGEAGIQFLKLDIQKNLSHLYFNHFFGILGIRNQIYGSNERSDAEGIQIDDFRLIQSLMLKFGVKTSMYPVVKTPVFVEPYVWGAWKFSNAITGKGTPFFATAGFRISL